MFMTLTGELSWQRLRPSAVDFYSKNAKNRSFSHHLGHALRGNMRTPSMARWKARGRLYIRRNWTFFRYLLRLRRYEAEIGRSWRFSTGVGHFERRFQREEASPTNHCWCQSSRAIALWYGIKISAVRHLVLSQSTRVTDRRTDRQTDRRTELRLPRTTSHMLAR